MKRLIVFLSVFSLFSFTAADPNSSGPIVLSSSPIVVCTTSPIAAPDENLGEQVSAFFASLFETQWWPARWQCGVWSPFHGWLYIVSDLAIACSYFLIPIILLYFIYQRKQQRAFHFVVLLFILFILACGVTHLLDASMFYWPAYRLNALTRFITAVISMGTVVALVKIAPQLMQLKSPELLESLVKEQTAELNKNINLISAYQRALDESCIVAITDHHGIIKHVNDNFCNISKYSKEELIGKDHRIINSGHHSKEFIGELWKTIGAGKIWKGELKNKAKDGAIYWVDTTIVPFLNEQGKPYQYVAIRADITERKIAEENLQKSLHEVSNYKYALDRSSIVAITDHRGIINHVNDNFCNISKYSKEELIGKDHRIINSGHHSKEFIGELWETIRAGKIWKGELKNKAKDGTIYWVDTTIVPFLNEHFKPYQYVAIRADITARKNAEDEQALLASIVNSSVDAIIGKNMNSIITSWNQGSERIFGYTAEEAVGKSISMLIPNDRINEETEIIKKIGRGNYVDHYETERLRKDGSRVPVSITISPITNAEGNIIGASKIARDISDRKRAEQEMAKSEIRFRDTLDKMLEGVQIIGFDWQYLYVNDVAAKHTQYSKAELLGHTVLEKFPGIETTEIYNVYLRCFNERVPIHMINEFTFPDQSIGWFELNFQPVPEGIFILSVDITERRRAEEENKRSEIRFRETLDKMLEGVEIIGFDWRYVYVNEAYEKQVGYSKEELLNHTVMEMFPGIEHTEIFKTIERCFYERVSIQLEDTYTFPDHTKKWFEMSFQPVPDGVFILSIDVTERKQVEEELIKREKRFRGLIENNNDIIRLSDNDFKPLYRSPNLERITGWKNEEIEAEGDFMLVHPDDRANMVSFLNEIKFNPEKIIPFTYRFKHKEGHFIWVEGTAINMLHDESIRGIISNFRDVTERKKAEEKLVANEKRFRALIENSYDVISLLDASFKVIYRSPSSARVLGWTDEELSNLPNTPHIHPDDLEYVQGIMDLVRSNPERSIQVLFRNKHKNGHYLWLEGSIVNWLHEESLHAIVFNFRDVTKRKELEELLLQANTLARIGSWEVNLENKSVYWSDITKEIHETEMNYIPNLTNGINFYKPGKGRDLVTQKVKDAIEHCKPWDLELQIITAKNNERWIRTIGKTEFVNGKCIRIYGSFQDIDQRKKAEEKLNQERTLLRTLIDNLPDYIYVKDIQSRHLINNRANVELMGASSENETLGKSVIDFFESDMARSYIENDQLVFQTGKAIVNQQESIMTLTGKKKYLVTTKVPIRDENNIITGLVGISRDITWQKQAEEKVAESERLYRTIASSMPETAVFIIDSELRFILAEGDLITKLGHTKEKLLGNFAKNALSPDRYEELLPSFLRALKGENFIQHFNRKDYHIVDKFVPFRNEEGEIYAAMIVVSDVTDIKRAEEALAGLNMELERKVNERTEQLKNANSELESFSYSVSHDLRAPLRAINGYAKMLEEDYQSALDENGKRMIGIVRDNAKQMGQLIDDLLAFSRLGRKEVHKEEVNMIRLVQSTIEELKIDQPIIEFKFGNLHVVWADTALLKQVLYNYISNAVKYSSKTERPRIEIKSTLVNNDVIYSVADNGSGFDMNYVHKLFQVFQRLHSQEEFEGTGVGLAIVSRIITKHGGKVWAESKIGEGATFYFSLPNTSHIVQNLN